MRRCMCGFCGMSVLMAINVHNKFEVKIIVSVSQTINEPIEDKRVKKG